MGYSSWGPKEGQVREGVPECDQLMHNSLTGLMVRQQGGVTGLNIINP